MLNKYNTDAHVCTHWRPTGCSLDVHTITSTELGPKCVNCLFHSHPAAAGHNTSETLPDLHSPGSLEQTKWTQLCSPVLSPASLAPATLQRADLCSDPDRWALRRHRAFSLSPASTLHVSFPLLVWQCTAARPLLVNRILGKKDKAKSITRLQRTLQKVEPGGLSLKNISKNVPKENFTSACLLRCYSYLKSMVLTEKQTPRLGTE